MGFVFFVNAPIYSLNADLFKETVGTAQGIMNSFFAFAGIVSPILTGWLVQQTGSFKAAIFFVSLLSILGFFVSFCLQRFERR